MCIRDSLPAEFPLESGDGVLSGLIVRCQRNGGLVTQLLGGNARGFVQRIVLPADDKVIRVAVGPGTAGRGGVRADVDRVIVHNLGHRGACDVREHDPGDQLDAVFIHELGGNLQPVAGLEPVVFDHPFDRHAARLPAFRLNGQDESVADLFAQIAGLAGKRSDQADFHRIDKAGQPDQRQQACLLYTSRCV